MEAVSQYALKFCLLVPDFANGAFSVSPVCHAERNQIHGEAYGGGMPCLFGNGPHHRFISDIHDLVRTLNPMRPGREDSGDFFHETGLEQILIPGKNLVFYHWMRAFFRNDATFPHAENLRQRKDLEV